MITIKTDEEIVIMRQGGRILAEIMEELRKKVKPGISSKTLDELAEKLIKERGAESAFKGYRSSKKSQAFPASLCVSINNELVHGIPTKEKILKEGDVVKLDLGIKYKDFCTDMARTVCVGKISKEAQKLISVTREALKIAESKIHPQNHLKDMSLAVQKYVESQGFSVVRVLVGHGVGRDVHEDPKVPNYWPFKEGDNDPGPKFKEGMALAIEPMVNLGAKEVEIQKDGTFVTKDGSLAAHFEDTVVVTKRGCEVLTKV